MKSLLLVSTITTMRSMLLVRAFPKTVPPTRTRTQRQQYRTTVSSSCSSSSSTTTSSNGSNGSIEDSSSFTATEGMRVESQQAFDELRTHYLDNQAKPPPPFFLPQSPSDVATYLRQHDISTVLFDCDGVLYRSPHAAPGAAACLQALQRNKLDYYFVTNNSAANPAQLRDKLTHLLQLSSSLSNDKDDNDNDDKVVVLRQDQMISTALTTAHYLQQQQDPPIRHVYLIGSDGLRDEIQRAGIQVVMVQDNNNNNNNKKLDNDNACHGSMSRQDLAAYNFDQVMGGHTVDAVVVGHDTSFSFRKLCLANVLLQRNPQAVLVATNMDAYDLVGPDGRHLPGNGSLVAAVAFSSGRQPIDCGKPSRQLASFLQATRGLDYSRTLFVGDRLDTDILFAVENGMHAALVLTGVTTVAQLQALAKVQPIQNNKNNNNNNNNMQPLPTLVMPHVGYLAGM